MNHADVVMKNTLPTPEETSSGDFLSEVAEFCEQFTGTRLTHRTISAITNKCRDLMAKYGQPRTIWVGYSLENGHVDIVDKYGKLNLLSIQNVKRVDSPRG